jgi:hypothetical protein
VTVPSAATTDLGTPFDRSERAIWRGSAEAYAATFAHLCAHLAPDLRDGALGDGGVAARLLDVGTGTGTVARAARERGADVVALDRADDFPRTVDGLATVLRGAGLTDVVVEERRWAHRVYADTWWAGPASGVATVGKVLTGATPEAQASARAHFDRLADELRDEDGLLALPHVALLGRGRRPA